MPPPGALSARPCCTAAVQPLLVAALPFPALPVVSLALRCLPPLAGAPFGGPPECSCAPGPAAPPLRPPTGPPGPVPHAVPPLGALIVNPTSLLRPPTGPPGPVPHAVPPPGALVVNPPSQADSGRSSLRLLSLRPGSASCTAASARRVARSSLWACAHLHIASWCSSLPGPRTPLRCSAHPTHRRHAPRDRNLRLQPAPHSGGHGHSHSQPLPHCLRLVLLLTYSRECP